MRTALRAVLAAILLTGVVSGQQSAIFAPAETLVVDGVPPIPQALVDDVSRYGEGRSARLAGWHPTEREMLVITRFADAPQVHRVRAPGGARVQLTFFPDRVTNASFSPQGGDFFVFTQDADGNELFQNYRYDLSTGTIARLTDGKSRNTPVVWSRAGDRVAYTSTRRTGADFDLYVVDPRDPATDRLLRQVKGSWLPLDWAPDGASLVARENVSANERSLWLVDVGSGDAKRVTPAGNDAVAYHDAHFAKDGKGLYVATDRDSEFVRAAYVDVATGAHTYLTTHINWDVEQIALSPDGRILAFISNEDGVGRLRLIDTLSRRERAAPKVPAGSVSALRWHRNSRDLGFQLVSSRAPEDVYSLDVQNGAVARWTYSETGGINTERLSEPELIHWTSADGRPISGFMYRPPARFAGRRPVIVNIHGGPELQFRPNFLGRLNYYLQELGIAFVFPNIRGSTGYGKTFLQLDNGLRRQDAYKDLGALFDWIGTRPDLDPQRIMVVGGSYGGHMTLIAATMYADRIRCAVDLVGPSNLATLIQDTSPYRQNLRRAEYGDERDPAVREFFERTAPVNNAAKITKPLFVIQGKNDPRVPLSESEKMVAAVRKNGTPVWYLMATDEGHGFTKKRNLDFQFYANVLFVKTFLVDGMPAAATNGAR